MNIFAQIPDPTPIIEQASESGWEAMAVVFVLTSAIVGLFLVIKWQLKQQTTERTDSQVREGRMAERINDLEQSMREMEQRHSENIARLTAEVTTTILKFQQTQIDMQRVLAELSMAFKEMNGDIAELCQLLKLSPCIAVSTARGNYKLVDKQTGKEIKLPGLESLEG